MSDDVRQPEANGGLHGLLFAGLLVGASLIPVFQVWPVPWVLALAGYFALAGSLPALKATRPRLRFGRISGRTIAATVVIAFLSWLVLTTFNRLARPDMSAYRTLLPIQAMGGVLSAGILFSLLNAVLEELAFRYVFYEAIAAERGPVLAVLATAVIFGIGHLHGFPPGPTGTVLAGIYGLALGWLRLFTGGIGLPVAAHVIADATIFHLVASSGIWDGQP